MEVQSVIILIAVFTVTFFPPLFSQIIPSISSQIQRKYVIVGASKFGQEIAEQLISHSENVTMALLSDESNIKINFDNIPLINFMEGSKLSSEMVSFLSNGTYIICATGNHEKSF